MSFIQLTAFRVNWKRLGMTDSDLQALEIAILEDPSRPPVMSGTGGLRKIRFSGQRSSGGKSGGVRVCYAYFRQFGLIYLCAVFPKNEKANLSGQEKNAYRHTLAEFGRYLSKHFDKGWTP
ncbi:MAG: addiction module toxin RelE [Tepidisphaeraceae bacterium]